MLLGIAIFAAIFLPIFFSIADAALTSTFFTAYVGRGYDQSWEVDSVNLVYQRYPHDESLTVVAMTQNTVGDTLSFYRAVAPGSYNPGYTLNAWALAYITTLSYPIRIDVHPAPFQVISVDTLRTDVSATVSVDSTDFAYVWNDNITSLASRTVTSSATGVGAHSDSIRILNYADSTPIGAGVQIWLRPNDGGSNLTNTNDANGWANFSVDADTFLVYVWTPGYQQRVTPDTNRVPNKDTTFTMYMNATSAAAAASPGLTPVAFNFFNDTGVAITNVILRFKLDTKSAENWHYDSSKVFDPGHIYELRSASTGLVTANVVPNDSIYTAGYQIDKTRWQFWAINPETGKQLLGDDGVKLNVTASETALTYPKDFVNP